MTKASQIILYAAAAVALLVAIFAFATYVFGIDNGATRVFNKIFPVLPAAIVGGDLIMLSEVDTRLAMYERAVTSQSAASIDKQKTRSEILDKLIEQEIVSDLLGREQIDAQPSFEDYSHYALDSLALDYEKSFGISKETFASEIVAPDYRKKLLAVNYLSENHDSEAYSRAEEARRRINGGLEFAAAAKLFSDDESSKHISGDVGLFAKETINPWYAEIAFSLAPSSTSEIVIAPDGYHILRVPVRDPGPPVRVQLQHIFIQSDDFEDYFQRVAKQYKIYIFVARQK